MEKERKQTPKWIRDRIWRMHRDGMSIKEICEIMGVSYNLAYNAAYRDIGIKGYKIPKKKTEHSKLAYR